MSRPGQLSPFAYVYGLNKYSFLFVSCDQLSNWLIYVMLFFLWGGAGVEIVSHLIVQAGLELGAVPLLQPPGYRD